MEKSALPVCSSCYSQVATEKTYNIKQEEHHQRRIVLLVIISRDVFCHFQYVLECHNLEIIVFYMSSKRLLSEDNWEPWICELGMQ